MFDPTTLVGFHTWLSLIALGAGVVGIMGLISGRAMPAWTAVFLLTATSTSATGFALPFERVLPSHIAGGLALVALAVALLAQYRFRLAGAWRWLYAVAAIVSVSSLALVGGLAGLLENTRLERARSYRDGGGTAYRARGLRCRWRRGGADCPAWRRSGGLRVSARRP